jgi:hypothetical protein
METDPFSETLCSLMFLVFFRIQDDGRSKERVNPDCYTPFSEPFKIYFLCYFAQLTGLDFRLL